MKLLLVTVAETNQIKSPSFDLLAAIVLGMSAKQLI